MVATWHDLPAAQQPDWPDRGHLNRVLGQLQQKPPLVQSADSGRLTQKLALVAAGQAFLLHVGSCAELFSDTPEMVVAFMYTVLPMVLVLLHEARLPIVKIGRIAGQYGKPRSAETETRDGVTLPSYRGDNINGFEFTPQSRQADPDRLLLAYDHSHMILAALQNLASGGFADLEHLNEWNLNFARLSSVGRRYWEVADAISRSIEFLKATGHDVANVPELHQTEFFTSHEVLLPGYEAALVRDGYASSAHLLWVGERTRQLDHAHVAFCTTIVNPIAVKLGPTATPDVVLQLCRVLNPQRVRGRLTFITRMGAGKVTEVLPSLLRAVQASGHPVVWVCDPMHGNTFQTLDGVKTRHFDTILREIREFFRICRSLGVWPGGVHLEVTGQNVTECLGSSPPFNVQDLSINYETACDPRLNPHQALELAFLIAELLSAIRSRSPSRLG